MSDDAKLRELRSKFSKLSAQQAEFNAEIFKIIHNPGWTTPVQIQSLERVVDAALNQTQTFAQQHTAAIQEQQKEIKAT